MSDWIITITEYIGTVAFAVSGAIISARYRLDLFGVTLVGCVTAVSGGMLRDVLSGSIPPAIFSKPVVLGVAAVVSIIVFIVFYANAKRFDSLERRIETVNVLFDAIGLAAFSVIGIEASFSRGFGENALFCVSMGVITGIGGGIVRDILVDKIPYVLKKHIYALASIAGSIVYYYMSVYSDKIAALLISMPMIIIIRLLAAKYHWKLPKIPYEDKE